MITMGTTQHEAAACGAHWLAELDFTSGTVYLTTAPVDVVAGGHTYRGLGAQLVVSNVSQSEDAAGEKVTLSVPVVDVSMLAAVLGPASTYRGRSVRLKLQLFDGAFKRISTPKPRWSGYMEPVKVTRQAATPEEGGAGGGRIEMPCQRAGMARARNYEGLRHTHAQQLLRHPGDLGFEYMQALIEAPALWLSKKFQEV